LRALQPECARHPHCKRNFLAFITSRFGSIDLTCSFRSQGSRDGTIDVYRMEGIDVMDFTISHEDQVTSTLEDNRLCAVG
jgi:hypothetical protein